MSQPAHDAETAAADTAASQHDVLVHERGSLGLLTLNRPKALNALTHGMVTAMRAALDEWATRPDIVAVAVVGAGDRGLCAGGDIVSLYEQATTGTGKAAAAFFSDEYRLNALIARYPKPYVAIMDGIVLGGGVGISAHGSHRIVTERSRIGMPETGIGFIPDVGGTWLLSRAPGELGTHLALTGHTVGAADAIELGLADTCVPSARTGDLLDALARLEPGSAAAVSSVIAQFAEPAGHVGLDADRAWIDEAYAGDDAAAIIDRMRASGIEAALAAANTIASRSPSAISLTLAALRRSAHSRSLEDSLALEFRIALRCIAAPDFAEGVRAQVIDKDRSPHWSPPTVAEVDPEAVEAAFAPLDEAERQRFGTTEWEAA
jgi:enoyl-CoA hydratase